MAVLDMAEGADFGAALDRDTGSENHVMTDCSVGSISVSAEK